MPGPLSEWWEVVSKDELGRIHALPALSTELKDQVVGYLAFSRLGLEGGRDLSTQARYDKLLERAGVTK